MKRAPKPPLFTGPLPVKSLKLITPKDAPGEALLHWRSGAVLRSDSWAYLTIADIPDLKQQGFDAVSLCDPQGHVLITLPF